MARNQHIPGQSQTQRDQFLHDVFVTAIEGGITYWARIEKYHWALPGEGNPLDRPDLKGFYAQVYDREDSPTDDGCNPRYRIDYAVIERGIEALATGTATYGGRALDPKAQAFYAGAYAVLDGGEIDASAADNIVQAGLWGDVRYG